MGEDQARRRRPVPLELGPDPDRIKGNTRRRRPASGPQRHRDRGRGLRGLPGERIHPYEKPPEVLGHILARVCRRGDPVLDPFAGSGSSRVAAEKLGLDLVWQGCDIDPQFAETRSSATASTPATA
jgi:DNA modification methylase